LFRSLQIDCAGGYLDSGPKIRLAGDGIPKAAGRAKQLMKNLPRYQSDPRHLDPNQFTYQGLVA
jgi:hypothetical protein